MSRSGQALGGWLARPFSARRPHSVEIYGTILAAATIAGVADASHDLLEIVLAVVTTVVVYWIAHAYAEVLGRVEGPARTWASARHELATSLPMVTACALPVAVLIIAEALGAGVQTAAVLALGLVVLQLLWWGYITPLSGVRRRRLGSSLLFGGLGVAIVILKLLVH